MILNASQNMMLTRRNSLTSVQIVSVREISFSVLEVTVIYLKDKTSHILSKLPPTMPDPRPTNFFVHIMESTGDAIS